jgi:hypothetical protein
VKPERRIRGTTPRRNPAPDSPPKRATATGGEAGPPPADLAGTVYVAAPMSLYRTARYDRLVAAIRALFPRAQVLDARSAWTSTEDWRGGGPLVLPIVSAVVVLADRGGWVGAGVVAEIDDAVATGRPIWHLTDDGVLHPWDAVALVDRHPDDRQRHARLALRPPEEPAGDDHRPPPEPDTDSWLAAVGPTLDPHTGSWYEALVLTQPHRAAIASIMVARAGRADVCSVCGDRPAPVYDDLDPPYLPLRLCADCLVFRRDGAGERLHRREGR